MKILDSNLPDPGTDATVVSIGNFDGVHAGHKQLIKTAVLAANQRNIQSIVLTFHPHPAVYFNPQLIPAPLSTRAYKQKLIASLGVDALITLTFNRELANLSPEEYFTSILLKKLNAKLICVGYDFTFGKNRKGNVRVLIELSEKYSIEATILPPQRISGQVVSSTKIREFLLQGDVENAAHFLQRQYLVHGTVIQGDRDGRHIGFPTINLSVSDGLIPVTGIYSGVANVDNTEYAAAIYIGSKPTHGGRKLRLEAHLLDFSGDIYNKDVSLAFFKFVRPEEKFDNIETLKTIIEKDCEAVKQDFHQYKINKFYPVIL